MENSYESSSEAIVLKTTCNCIHFKKHGILTGFTGFRELTTYNIPVTPTTKPQRRGGTEDGTEDCYVLNLWVSAVKPLVENDASAG
ncbi:MAG: hypothetical protein U9N09_07035 [Euryarchaeota archaeon]|nr:hypothetical protein [Euryarchaeota archaeon]